MKLSSKIGVALALIALASTAHAAKIIGKIDFTGQATLNGSLTTATQVTAWSGLSASQATGSFAPVVTLAESTIATPFSQVVITSPWSFNSGAVTPLWKVGPTGSELFFFDLTSSVKNPTSNASFLDVSGTGFVYGSGFERTFGTWTFNITNASTGDFSFQSSTASSVPDGGSTVALLGLSFLGLGGVSRLLRRK